MDIKDWILIGGSILLVAVIVHGFWVAWSTRRDTLKMAIDHNVPQEEIDDLLLLRGELPHGGARQKTRRADPDATSVVTATAGRSGQQSQQSSLFNAPESPHQSSSNRAQSHTKVDSRKNRERTGDKESGVALKPGSAHKKPSENKLDAETQEILVIRVLARDGQTFLGNDLMEVFLRNGLKFGDMNIFHRLDVTTRATQFSIVSVVEPGSFDLSNMDEFATPGVNFFMKLPGPADPMAAFEDMLAVARDFTDALQGDLKDEQMGVITAQTIEHLKQRIADFSRKRMSRRAV